MVAAGVRKNRSIWKWQSNTAMRIWRQERPWFSLRRINQGWRKPCSLLSSDTTTLTVKVSFSTLCKWPLSRSRNERKRSGAKRGEINPGPGSTWASDTPDKSLLSCPSSGCKLIAWLLNTRVAHAGKAQANYSMGPELRGPVFRGILGLQGCSREALICHQACC